MPTAKKFILPPGRSTIGKPESWPLPPDAARILARVGPTAIPILCLGSRGTAFLRIATTLHRASGRSRLVRIDVRNEPLTALLALPPGRVGSYLTIALDGLEALDIDGQRILSSYLDDAAPRLVSGTTATTEELSDRLPEDLFTQLSLVNVTAPALRERRGELPQLAAERLEMLAAELEVGSVPRLTPDAQNALAAHDWPGDVTELDALLLEVLLRENPEDPVDLADLRFRHAASASTERPSPHPAPGPGSEPRPRIVVPATSKPPDPPSDATPHPDPEEGPARRTRSECGGLDALESVAVELAHQLKNPLVTVKTFISNAARMDEAETARFREIALEGIDRIDGPIDQILDFSRLPKSMDETVEISERLRRAFGECGAILESKAVVVEGLPVSSLSARGAGSNVDFALETLSRHVAETIEPQGLLTISRPSEDVMRLHYRESGASTHLRGVTGDPESSFPLALLLVRGALTRMGGGLRTSHGQNEVTIELTFTPA